MFISKEFKSAWEEWKKHKSNLQGRPYTEVAERKALSSLYQRCSGQETVAINSINYSIENNWAAIYIQNNINGTGQTQNNGQSNIRNSVKDELDKRYGNREQAAN